MAYFQTLGVPKTCYEADLLKAFRAFSLRWHPQRNRAPEAIGRFAETCEAYQILIDARFKSVYERLGPEGPRFEGFTPAAPDTVFKGFWKKYGGEDIVAQYLANGGDSAEEPPDFQPTIERLEAVQKFDQLYKGDHLPSVNPWRPTPPPSAGAANGASIREQMMSQWRDRKDTGPPGSRRLTSAAGRPRDTVPSTFSETPSQGLMAGGAPEDDRIAIATNARVLIMGLKSEPIHNGKMGTVQGIAGDRYTVQPDQGLPINVRSANVMQMPKVQVVGALEEAGMRGVVVGFDADAQRYAVQVSTGAILQLKAGNVLLSPQTCVMLTGLTDAAHYNGKWGKVLDADVTAGRYLVKLDEKTQLRVKLDNARIATPPLVV